MGFISGGMVLGVASLAVDWLGVQSFVFVVISSFVVGLNVIGCGIGKLTAVSSAVLLVNCGSDCGL